MRKGNHRKLQIVVVMMIAAVLALTTIGGSLAYFTDTDSATNTFTVGSVEINQVEQEADGTDYVNDPEEKVYMPIVNAQNPTQDENFIDKVVFVENVGENSAYIRTFIAVPAALDDIIKLSFAAGTDWRINTAQTATIDGVDYVVYPCTYITPVAAGDATANLLLGTYMLPTVDIKPNPDAQGAKQFCTPSATAGEYTFYDWDVEGQINIVVASQAVQSQGFADAYTALNTAFPNNPWA